MIVKLKITVEDIVESRRNLGPQGPQSQLGLRSDDKLDPMQLALIRWFIEAGLGRPDRVLSADKLFVDVGPRRWSTDRLPPVDMILWVDRFYQHLAGPAEFEFELKERFHCRGCGDRSADFVPGYKRCRECFDSLSEKSRARHRL